MAVASVPAAEHDLEELAYYIGVVNQRPQAAERLIADIVAKAEQYGRQPEMGTMGLSGALQVVAETTVL